MKIREQLLLPPEVLGEASAGDIAIYVDGDCSVVLSAADCDRLSRLLEARRALLAEGHRP